MATRDRAPSAVAIQGVVAPGYENVRTAFQRNFDEFGEVGAAVCVHHQGRVVVDLWGGMADEDASRAYVPDTLQVIFSASKGVTAVLFHVLCEQGVMAADAPVATYWPEFAVNGKEGITLRQVLSHQAGLPAVHEKLRLRDALAWDPVVDALAKQAPDWEPGTDHGYHPFTVGWIVGESMRRATGKSVGALLQENVAEALDLEVWIGLPEAEDARVAPLRPSPPPKEGEPPDPLTVAIYDPATYTHTVFTNPPLPVAAFNSPNVRAAEIPAGNAVTTARSLSRLYAACIGEVDGTRLLSPKAVEAARATQAQGPDRVLPRHTRYGVGFQLPAPTRWLGGPGSFGHYGMGGSVGFAHPERELAFAYVMNQMQSPPGSDPRSVALVEATLAATS